MQAEKSPRILYIEDHADTRELVTLLLAQKSYEVITGSTIASGVSLATAEQFDLSRRFRPWLFTIAANKARDLIRSQARRPTNPLQASISPSDDDSGEFIDLMQSMAAMPDDSMQREELQAIGWERPVISAVTRQGLRELVGEMAALVHEARVNEPQPEVFRCIGDQLHSGGLIDR